MKHTSKFLLPIFLLFLFQGRTVTGTEAPRLPIWPPAGKSVKIPVTSDTSLSSVGKETLGSNGGNCVLKLKGQQEVALLSFNADILRGKIVTGALLHIRSASPRQAPLTRLGVSTVATPWKEGTSTSYRPQHGAASFAQAAYLDCNWAYPGSTLMDVVFGKGNTLWKFSNCTPPDKNGWQACAVDAGIIASVVAGLSHGLCLYDEEGNSWSQQKGVFSYHYFPNRFFFSRETRSGPWLEVWTGGEDHSPPAPVGDVIVAPLHLLPGEAFVKWNTPQDFGRGKTLGFQVTYADASGEHPVPRYLIPMAGNPGDTVTMHLQDLPLAPGTDVNLKITPVDSAGNKGITFAPKIRVAENIDVPSVVTSDFVPFKASSSLPALNGITVSILDLTDKVNPINGSMLPHRDIGYQGGNHLFDGENKKIKLYGARNETVFFQVNLAGHADKIAVRFNFDETPLLKPKIFKFNYVQTKNSHRPEAIFPDPLLPLEGDFSIPDRKGQTEVATHTNQSLICELYIPHAIAPGERKGHLTVTIGDQSMNFTVSLKVWNFTLPDKLSFIPEMNAYGTVYPFHSYKYYRLAHEHRTCINWLPYGWNGKPALAPQWDGSDFNWKAWDKQISPLLYGSAFAGLPREGEPVDVFYLPINENWPVELYHYYTPSYWADEAFSAGYSEKLGKAMHSFAEHLAAAKWTETIFQFYLNNKVIFRKKFPQSSAPWIFDEPINTQDFWALRWYGKLWKEATSRVAFDSGTALWFRSDISYSQFSRNMLWGILDIEYIGGNSVQKTRMKHDEQMLSGLAHFTEYGSANKIDQPNTQPVLWCIAAWLNGANGVLPWQTIGTNNSWKDAEQTALFYPHPDGPYPSVRLKAFTRGQQDVEYLTLFGKTYNLPRYAIEKIVKNFIGMESTVKKTSTMDAGTISFDSANSINLWRLRAWLGQMISEKAPPYERQLVTFKTLLYNGRRLPDLGYAEPAPLVNSARPDCDSFLPPAN